MPAEKEAIGGSCGSIIEGSGSSLYLYNDLDPFSFSSEKFTLGSESGLIPLFLEGRIRIRFLTVGFGSNSWRSDAVPISS